MPKDMTDGQALQQWLRTELSVSAAVNVCQKWLSTSWSSSGVLLSPEVVEETLGERLRLMQYRNSFSDDAEAKAFSEVLLEGQPPIKVSVTVLRQWYVKYHPDLIQDL